RIVGYRIFQEIHYCNSACLGVGAELNGLHCSTRCSPPGFVIIRAESITGIVGRQCNGFVDIIHKEDESIPGKAIACYEEAIKEQVDIIDIDDIKVAIPQPDGAYIISKSKLPVCRQFNTVEIIIQELKIMRLVPTLRE